MESVPEEMSMLILSYLPNTDLLQCSLVSKRLNYEARSVLRNRGSLLTKLKFYRPCHAMDEFVSMLEQMDIIPLSGIRFAMIDTHRYDCRKLWPAELADRIQKELNRLSWKQLSLAFPRETWWENRHCPALLMAKTIMTNFSGVLEKLTLQIGTRRQEFVQEIVQDCHFPRLKVLALKDVTEHFFSNNSPPDFNSFVRAMVSRAPNLREVHIENGLDLMDNVLEGSSAVLWIHHNYFQANEMIPESLVGAVRLEALDLDIYGRDFSVQRYNWITPMLLQASSKTLSSVQLNLEFALPLMSYGVCLENVRRFKMYCNNYNELESSHPRVLEIVKQFDFTRIFPALNQVSVSNVSTRRRNVAISPTILAEFVEQADAILRVPLPDRAVRIKKLNLNYTLNNGVPFFREMFPHVETLSISHTDRELSSYSHTWEQWKHLKTLEIEISDLFIVKNLDSAFCGIFPEEVEDLRQRDEEYLKRVNIVPVMPPITRLKDLMNLKIGWSTYRRRAPQYNDSTVIFSKVTGLVVLARWPTLAVTVESADRKIPQVLSHLKPHVSFQIDSLHGLDI